MAQTRQVEDTGETPPGGTGQSQGLLGNSTLILLVIFAVAFFLWNRRRQTAMQERLQAQRREREEMAARSAQDVAHIMRRPVDPGAAAAAATEGLASAARMPAAPAEPPAEERAGVMERDEARTEAERAAEEQAAQAARAADLAAQQREAEDALRAAMRDLDHEIEIPLGAVAGDGTATCPPGFPIKGNASSRIYHVPGQSSYPPTIPEFCFASAEAAEAAGFRQSRARGQRAQE